MRRSNRRNISVLNDQLDNIAEYRQRTFSYGLDFGREFGNWGEIRTGYTVDRGKSHVRIGDPDLPVGEFDSRGYFVRMSYDRLDDINFPRHGQSATLEWDGQRQGLGGDTTADRAEFNWIVARTFGRQTAVWWTSMGTALNTPSPDLRTLFKLGGFLNLSGAKADSLIGPHFGITRLLLYRQIGRGGPGFLDVPVYLGLSLEAGNVWQTRSDASFGGTRKDASLFLGPRYADRAGVLGDGIRRARGSRRSTCSWAERSKKPSSAGRLRAGALVRRLEPARLGELFDFLEDKRRLVARARVLVAPAHLGEGRIALFWRGIPVQPMPLFPEKLTEWVPGRQADANAIRPQLFDRRPPQVV